MQKIQIYDEQEKRPLMISVDPNNRLSHRELSKAFPGVLGLVYTNTDGQLVWVSSDEEGNYFEELNPDTVYKPRFPNSSRRPSQTSTSWATKISNALTAVGVIIALWIGSVIPSLWANIYEETLKLVSTSQPSFAAASTPPSPPLSPPSEPTLSYGTRIGILAVFSVIYLTLAILITPTAIKKWWNNFGSWLFGIDVEALGYNALFQSRSAAQSPQE